MGEPKPDLDLEAVAQEWWDDACGSEYGCPDSLADLLRSVAEEAHGRAIEQAAKAVPSNWVDGLLTGPRSALAGKPGKWGCPEIERLLQAIASRLRALAAEAKPEEVR